MKKQENSNQRESFVFYRSYYNAIQTLSIKNRLKIYDAIVEYALNQKITENLPKRTLGIFEMAKPNIDACNKKYLRKIERKKQKNNLDFEQEVAEKVQLPEREDELLPSDEFE